MPNVETFSRKKKALFVLIMIAMLALFSEGVSRIIFYIKEDFNPYYITFGFVQDTDYHSNELSGYSKFPMNTYYHEKVKGGINNIKINGDGFRGLRDPVRPKPRDIIRIVALGGSSTFGYGVGDKDTYPYQLEEMFGDVARDKRVEVLNLGVPHARLNNIVALANQELPGLEPDLIILFCGYNNAMWTKEQSRAGMLYGAKTWLFFHSIAYRVVHDYIRNAYYMMVTITQKDVVGLPGLSVPVKLNREQIAKLSDKAVLEFTEDLATLLKLADHLSSKVILVKENYTLYKMHNSGLNDKWRTYKEEIDVVEGMLDRDGVVPSVQVSKLIHRDLMKAMQQIASSKRLPLVDGIKAVEADPANMLSHVHLSRLGNGRLAEMIYTVILKEIFTPVDGSHL